MSGWISSLINAGSQQLTNAWNKSMNDDNNKVNKEIAEATNASNMALNEANIAFQRETNNLNYQRQLAENNLTREREDTAYSRAAKDLEAAGLSKTLAAGSPAASASMTASQAQAPQHKFQMQRYEQKAFKADAIKVDADILDSLQKIKNIQHTGASTEYQNWLNDFVMENNMLPGSNSMIQGVYALEALVDNAIGAVFNRQHGTVPSFSSDFIPAPSTSSANSSPVPQSLDARTVSNLPLESETKKVVTQESNSNARPLPATVGDSASSTSAHKKLSYEDLYLPPVYNTKAKKWALAGLAGALLAGGPKFVKNKNMVDNWPK